MATVPGGGRGHTLLVLGAEEAPRGWICGIVGVHGGRPLAAVGTGGRHAGLGQGQGGKGVWGHLTAPRHLPVQPVEGEGKPLQRHPMLLFSFYLPRFLLVLFSLSH